MAAKKIILIIMDGWGLGKVASADAIQNAKTPFVSSLYSRYPNTTLITCGEAVGLPDGQMGNSEVGHLNLGAGRIVYQELQRINVAVRDGSFAKNEVLLNAIRFAKKNNKPLHLLGLVSNGGVHSHIDHLKAIVDACKKENLSEVFIHAFTDGRDCDPKSGLGFIKNLQEHLNGSVGKIASVSGRYYAMDRDKRWERIKLTYDALVHAEGLRADTAAEAIAESHEREETDEFIRPTVIGAYDGVADGDAVLHFNFRPDRARELVMALGERDFAEFDRGDPPDIDLTTLTEYRSGWPYPTAFPPA